MVMSENCQIGAAEITRIFELFKIINTLFNLVIKFKLVLLSYLKLEEYSFWQICESEQLKIIKNTNFEFWKKDVQMGSISNFL